MALVGKDQLVHEVAERSGLELAEARRAIEEMLGAIETQLAKGNEVRITGFGKFSVSRRKARKGRNPQTGESMKIAAKKVPHFSAGAELRKAVPRAPQERASRSEPKPAIDTTDTQASATSQTKRATKLSGAKARPQKKRGSRKATTDVAASEDEASPEDEETTDEISQAAEGRTDEPHEAGPKDEATSQKERERAKGARRRPRTPRKSLTRKDGEAREDEAPEAGGADEEEPAEANARGEAISVATPGVKSALVAVAGLAAGVAGGLAVMHRR